MGGAFSLTHAPHSTPQPWRGYGALRGRGWGVNRCAGLTPPLAGDLALSSLLHTMGWGAGSFWRVFPERGSEGSWGECLSLLASFFLSPPLRSSALTSQIHGISTCPPGWILRIHPRGTSQQIPQNPRANLVRLRSLQTRKPEKDTLSPKVPLSPLEAFEG